MQTRSIKTKELSALLDQLRAAGVEIIAPARAPGVGRAVVYRRVSGFSDIIMGVQPRGTLKEHFLPASERILGWRRGGAHLELLEASTDCAPRIVLGAFPCDAAALEVVDAVMGWDYRDEFWFNRRQATIVVSIACDGGDESCFCHAVGLSPGSTRGADLMFVPVDGGFQVEVTTGRGQAWLEEHQEYFSEAGDSTQAVAFQERATTRSSQRPRPHMESIGRWLKNNFQHDYWDQLALRCHGCGACTMVCPTCHCFDLVDEPEGPEGGSRRRNWDTCQAATFTLHASGHNPRPGQGARYRQRILHKFSIYPARFHELLCTGCGRCSRVCSSGMDMLELLGEIHDMASITEPTTSPEARNEP